MHTDGSADNKAVKNWVKKFPLEGGHHCTFVLFIYSVASVVYLNIRCKDDHFQINRALSNLFILKINCYSKKYVFTDLSPQAECEMLL